MDAIGGGVLVAVAAALWIAYLLPTWLRQRQYVATERNAVRLQQTLRILAETAETPEPVRIEATAREVAVQQRILAEQTEAARLEAEAAEQLAIAERILAAEHALAARAVAARALATEPIAIVAAPAAAAASEPAAAFEPAAAPARSTADAAARRSLRRRRALCSLVMLLSLVTVIVGLVGAAFGLPILVAGLGVAGVVVGFAGVLALARRRPAVASVAVVAAPEPESQPFEPIELAEAEAEPDEGWTPQTLPKALHLSRGTIAAAAMASIQEAEQLRRSAVEAELAERAAELAPKVPTLAPRSAPAQRPAVEAGAPAGTATNPYARMGVVDDTTPGFESLDTVLRRRREAV
ncbi:hypothetical protein GE115_14065 [Agromyces sp. CFH 90414]|uniref:Large exoprotein n=1 Tax=Agromyces agglutinans TaxID=2662258 RepID=A0A6I2F845_9MICO|nr:hypothetical protein [Agromyces agglutinans]MRG60982.1 hypothetical protein [Agromyces agglutinans]